MLLVNMWQVRTKQLAMSDATLVGTVMGFICAVSFLSLRYKSSCTAIQAC